MPILVLAAALSAAPSPSQTPTQALSPAESAALGKKAIALLTQFAREGDAEGRAIVAAAWGEIGNHGALPLLREALKDRNVGVRIEAATSLHKLGDDPSAKAALEAVIVKASTAAASSPRDELMRVARDKARAKAIARLAEFGGEQAATLFERTIEDPSAAVRDATALALARMGFEEFGAPFLEAAHAKDEGVRAEAARSLGAVTRPEYFAALKELAEDSAADVRLAAVDALAGFDGADAAPVLEQALRDGDARVRAKALLALSRIPDQGTRAALRQALKDAKAPEAALKAAAGLALRGDAVDLGLAERALKAKDADLKALALDVLRAAPGADATLLLKRVMDDEKDARLKLTAATALVKRLQRRGA